MSALVRVCSRRIPHVCIRWSEQQAHTMFALIRVSSRRIPHVERATAADLTNRTGSKLDQRPCNLSRYLWDMRHGQFICKSMIT